MAKSRVVIIRAGSLFSLSGEPDTSKLLRMFQRGFELLQEERDGRAALLSIFNPNDRVGVKINTIGGKAISTRPQVSLALASWFTGNGLRESNLLVWDRTNRELRDAGYKLAADRNGVRIFGTDADGAGYEKDLVSHLNIGSLFSKIQTDFATASVSLAILKDHGLAGVTAGLKNYFGAIHNPNKYHDHRCDPFVAEVFDAPAVKSKHRLTILDCLTVQYHKGPSYHPQWAEKYQGLIFSRDPVAADRVGWSLIERLRAGKGLPTLEEEGRAPLYLATAERLGLGRSDLREIEAIEETIP
jgi:uncharacterized protein (DUF362 family)